MAQNNRLLELATAPVARLLWRYSMPAVVGMVVNSLYNVIDRIFIGRGVGSDAIAGLAITFPVMNLSAAIGVLIGAGAAARVSILLGANDQRNAAQVLGNALVLTLVNALVYLGVFAVFLDPILVAFGASPASLPYAKEFLTYLLPGMLVMNLSFSFNNIMRASGYPVRAMVTMFIGTLCNLCLAPLFIFALGWGIKGAAIATDISMTVSACFVFSHFFKRDSTLHFQRGIYRLKWPIVLGIISIGAAPSVVNAAGSIINVIVNTSLYRYGGDSAVAAAGIFTTVASLLVMVVVGICQGMQPIIGYNYGAGRLDRLRRVFWLASGVSTAICAAGFLAGMTVPDLIARAFTVDEDLVGVTANALRIAMVMFWCVGFQIVATTFFQSIGKAGQSIFLSLTRQVLFMIPFLLLFPSHMGLDGIWAAFPASDTCATVVTAVMVFCQMRRLGRMRPGVRHDSVD